MVVNRFAAAARFVERSVTKHFVPHHPCPHGPTRQRLAMPGAPLALRLLLFITNHQALVEVDEYQIRVVTNRNAALVDDVPDPRRRDAMPMRTP